MQVQDLNVTLTFISVCASAMFAFGTWIGPLRGRLGVLRGDGGNAELFKRIRIHGNFIENAPLFALVLAGAEALGAADGWLWAAVGAFVAGRAYRFVRYDRADRGVGLALTTLPALFMGVYVLVALRSAG